MYQIDIDDITYNKKEYDILDNFLHDKLDYIINECVIQVETHGYCSRANINLFITRSSGYNRLNNRLRLFLIHRIRFEMKELGYKLTSKYDIVKSRKIGLYILFAIACICEMFLI